MLSDERRMELSDVLRPVAPPREIDNVYTDDQRERLLNVVHTRGPWRLIIAQHFASADELMATMSGAFPEGSRPRWTCFSRRRSAATSPTMAPCCTRNYTTASTTPPSLNMPSATGTLSTPSRR